jgi:hypothetical protein
VQGRNNQEGSPAVTPSDKSIRDNSGGTGAEEPSTDTALLEINGCLRKIREFQYAQGTGQTGGMKRRRALLSYQCITAFA